MITIYHPSEIRGLCLMKFIYLGMQIDHEKFKQMFYNQTKDACGKTGELACYVIDNNGFVIVSEKETQTGKFFGEVDGTILDSLIQHQIYRKIEIYDYQAICLESEDDGSPANFLSNPFRMVQGTICISTYVLDAKKKFNFTEKLIKRKTAIF